MGCLPCFDSNKEEEGDQLNPKKISSSHELPTTMSMNMMQPPPVHKLPSGLDKQRIKKKEHHPSMEKEKEKEMEKEKEKDIVPAGVSISAQTFTFRELATATRNFRPECFLGEGGFGRVYKGRLESTGQVVAIKQLNREGLQGNREFLVEVLMLSLLHHQNLVNLIGYCADGEQRLLVYEYMPFGSLEDHLHDVPADKEPLDWNTRMKIAAGAAKGLEYLHDKATPPVIYRDFKSSNILLDESFHPKLSDFGLAKLGPVGDKSHVSTRVMGTYGYCAPEYAMTGQLTVKSDVYSFGVVLLELITGRKAIDSTRPHAQQNLVSWARPLFNDRRKLPKMADPRLESRYPMRGLYQALAVASMCIQSEAASRPLIADVVTALSYLASQVYDPANAYTAPGNSRSDRRGPSGNTNTNNSNTNDSNTNSGNNGNVKERGDSPRDNLVAGLLNNNNKDYDRERAVAEAKMWGENWREKRKAMANANANGVSSSS